MTIRYITVNYWKNYITCISTHDFRLPTDWLRLTAICHHNDPKLFELADRFITESPLNQPFHRESWLFYLWGHSYEFDDHNNWDRMETFAEKAGQKEDVWYATNIEIYDYINAYNNLKFSINGDYVYNPSCFPIWLKKNRTLFCVKPNDQIHI